MHYHRDDILHGARVLGLCLFLLGVQTCMLSLSSFCLTSYPLYHARLHDAAHPPSVPVLVPTPPPPSPFLYSCHTCGHLDSTHDAMIESTNVWTCFHCSKRPPLPPPPPPCECTSPNRNLTQDDIARERRHVTALASSSSSLASLPQEWLLDVPLVQFHPFLLLAACVVLAALAVQVVQIQSFLQQRTQRALARARRDEDLRVHTEAALLFQQQTAQPQWQQPQQYLFDEPASMFQQQQYPPQQQEGMRHR